MALLYPYQFQRVQVFWHLISHHGKTFAVTLLHKLLNSCLSFLACLLMRQQFEEM